MAKRLEQLKKLKMPQKPIGEKEAEMDLDMELGEMEGAEKMPEDMMAPEGEEDEMGEMAPEEELFKDIDDDMLIAEMKKRGLSLDGAKEEPAEDEMA